MHHNLPQTLRGGGEGGSDNVNIPFQLFVPQGESSFTVSVPRHYDIIHHNGIFAPKRRMFKFSQLSMTPGYFSQKAAQLDINSRREEAEPVKFSIRASYTASPGLYRIGGLPAGEELRWDHTGGFVNATIKSFNAFFETTAKPVGFKSAPCFIDWIDRESWELPLDNEYYRLSIDYDALVTGMENTYYENLGGDGDEGDDDGGTGARDHFDSLEESSRRIWNVNNYAFPPNALLDSEPQLLASLRLRLHIAPNTGVQFSSLDLLTGLGFSAGQVGKRGRLNRYYFDNPHKDQYIVVVADNAPPLPTIPRTNNKVNVYMRDRSWASLPAKTVMELTKFRKDNHLRKAVNDLLELIALNTNIDVDCNYNEATKKFEFVFPENDNLNVTLHMPKALCNRMGFGPGVTKITKASVSRALSDYGAVQDAELLAKTLVYDTGMVLVTFDSLGSMSTIGTTEYFMACLLPRGDGTLSMSPPTLSSPTIYLPSSGATQAQLLFNIWAYNEDGTTRQLEWKTGLYVAGILAGI